MLTTYTDLVNRKIMNAHLILGAALGVAAIAYTAIVAHADVVFHIVNGIGAFLIGFLLYRTKLWRGGDAKLFTLFSFLMPLPEYNVQPFPSAFSLFACSFLGGSIILLPAFIKDTAINHKVIAQELFLPKKRQGLFLGIGGMIYFSWALFPLYYIGQLTNPAVLLTIMYLIFNWTYNDEKEVKKHFVFDFLKKNLIVITLGVFVGFMTRLLLSPASLSWQALGGYLTRLILISFLSIAIHTIFRHFKDYQDRVPFAPLIFIGCLLSYSQFLPTLLRMIPLFGQ
ncbi:MAG: hypothetical protein IT395_04355 [Candidatus Omnitrophica bacterium]|nr:hypothetical protein [Candidatus Omnitrophota bacterium]